MARSWRRNALNTWLTSVATISRFEQQIQYRGPRTQWHPSNDHPIKRLDAFVGDLPAYGIFGNTILQYCANWITIDEDGKNPALEAMLIETAKTTIRRALYPVLKSVERYRRRSK